MTLGENELDLSLCAGPDPMHPGAGAGPPRLLSLKTRARSPDDRGCDSGRPRSRIPLNPTSSRVVAADLVRVLVAAWPGPRDESQQHRRISSE
jgi:hypothetical protein